LPSLKIKLRNVVSENVKEDAEGGCQEGIIDSSVDDLARVVPGQYRYVVLPVKKGAVGVKRKS
jgi:hypothetical protein